MNADDEVVFDGGSESDDSEIIPLEWSPEQKKDDLLKGRLSRLVLCHTCGVKRNSWTCGVVDMMCCSRCAVVLSGRPDNLDAHNCGSRTVWDCDRCRAGYCTPCAYNLHLERLNLVDVSPVESFT
eukprot:gnl/MRDRNA2_/MRDRNA2_67705_c0_seq1.p1 gnl/MRDRNA2_/MRDRNA2_67705_c0~~gnl/MRDRNA2_/MRDRNA2_67705_c0_seq1.p1  ORF type:complete len:125 (+),score=3.81 gnl/MRDRNA2_/MRDRNA2_67705_c0_seq1:3-377(+)